MNHWLVAAAILTIAGIVPCGLVCFFAAPLDSLVALELAGTFAVVVLMLLAEGIHRQPFIDVALILAALSVVGAVAYARFLEREL